MVAKVIHFQDVEARRVETEGVKDVTIRWLISKKDGAPNFAMRHFTLEPGGYTPCHRHPWEHEVFVVRGKGHLYLEGQRHALQPGVASLVPGDVEHQFLADEGQSLEFLCFIPNSGQ